MTKELEMYCKETGLGYVGALQPVVSLSNHAMPLSPLRDGMLKPFKFWPISAIMMRFTQTHQPRPVSHLSAQSDSFFGRFSLDAFHSFSGAMAL